VLVLVAVSVVMSVVMLAACGGGGGGGNKTVTVDNGQITIEARDNKFDVKTIETKAGPLGVTLLEKGNQNHTFVVEGVDNFKLSVSSGASNDTGTVELDPGTYAFFCDVPTHRALGMEGTLVVE
jgi:plastocyanin